MVSILALTLLLAQNAASQSALRVVVIEGEDAVNVIQQKTAVRPVVEVRDRNNLPVSGAIVTFSIEGGKAATFGGASTLTVATNAAGQAAVSGLTPSAAGAFQIQVSAAFQGQVATATIAQTNVLTAAQAAAAGASSASGASSGSGAGGAGGAAGGGGLSTTTIAVAGAAIAGGAVAATQIVDKVSEEKYSGQFSGQITGSLVSAFNTCNYVRSVTATATLRFKEHSDTSVRGEFEYEGAEAVVSTTCAGGTPTSPQFIGQVDLSGSPSNFSGRNVYPGPPTTVNGATITGEHIYTFQGSISGDSATGVFNYEENSLSTGGGGSDVRQLGTGSFTITFQKS
jgi:hypothetical protein